MLLKKMTLAQRRSYVKTFNEDNGNTHLSLIKGGGKKLQDRIDEIAPIFLEMKGSKVIVKSEYSGPLPGSRKQAAKRLDKFYRDTAKDAIVLPGTANLVRVRNA